MVISVLLALEPATPVVVREPAAEYKVMAGPTQGELF
jgi:hypothetical protein